MTAVRNPPATARIVNCASYGGPYAGSFVPMLAAISRAARAAGYETTICFSEVAQNRPWLAELGDLAEIRFIMSADTRRMLGQLKRVLDEDGDRPTLLHTHFGAFDATAAVLSLVRRHTAVLWHVHSEIPRPVRLRSKAYGAVFGRIVDGALCVSPTIYESLLQRHFPRAKLHQLPNAIDLSRFTPITAAERSAARQRLGLAASARVVLHFGWDWHRKGGDLLLAAADELAAEPDLTFLTVTGDDDEDRTRERFARHRNVRALPPHANVNELYAAADIFVSCSRAEGMPYAVLEALARGLPVVATNLPAQRAVIAQLPGSSLVAPEAGAVAGGLRELLALTPHERFDHAALARARVAGSYALDPWAAKVVDLYREALDGTHRS